jgi:hypothetical protein
MQCLHRELMYFLSRFRNGPLGIFRDEGLEVFIGVMSLESLRFGAAVSFIQSSNQLENCFYFA